MFSRKKPFSTKQQGARFEQYARLFLENQGLHFVAANQNFKCGELDLIMLDGETLVFVEVRQRKNDLFGSAVESVDWHKQQKWQNAANLWLIQQGQSLEDADCRFDLVAFGQSPKDIEWIPNFLD
ncbi:YraN family protein [Lonepinella sp. BR2882]|uniref:YraN family protein n=1 Tax=Lonepinella sp. BR2882 TaxID=3095283 RepID=UPI003F6DE943